MELPDCPPGAEGYEDTVVEVPKKLDIEGGTKAEQEFLEHLNSLQIKIEDGSIRGMVERRGRDVSGKWIYLCYPCAAQCSGESVLQVHLSGKKHKTKLGLKSVWPASIFKDHPFIVNEKGEHSKAGAYKIVQKMKEEENLHNSFLEEKYKHYRNQQCHIQDILDDTKAPLLGVEYLIEHPPDEPHHEPMYICILCYKHGHPRTIVNHLTCFSHRSNYLNQHFPKASKALLPFRHQKDSRTGLMVVMNRLTQCIEHKYGRMKPVNFQKEDYERNKEEIHKWIYKGPHFCETESCTFEEVVDGDLISSLNNSAGNRDPSPPVVAAPSKPKQKPIPGYVRGVSTEPLSDISDEEDTRKCNKMKDLSRYSPYNKFMAKSGLSINSSLLKDRRQRPGNFGFKVKRAKELREEAEEAAQKMLAYHEKNPEKHPLYPEEWKKFWNRRYKELQTEGKDPGKHDFKPEWIKFWTGRMKELHDEELRVAIHEIYRKFSLEQPPDDKLRSEKRRSLERKRSRSPGSRRRTPEYKKQSQHRFERRRSLDRKRSHERRRSLERRNSSERRRHYEKRLPDPRYTVDHRSKNRILSPSLRRSPLRHLRTRSRSPVKSRSPTRGTWQGHGSPLSQRDQHVNVEGRNPSPVSRQIAPSMQTVLISDDELKADGTSPWDSDDSIGSFPEIRSPVHRSRSRADSRSSRASHARHTHDYQDIAGSADNIVGTLRMLVALEDHLGSLGPKVVDLLAEAIRMEKEQPNSSENLFERESALVLIETAKEKLKGSLQAGLVTGSAVGAIRSAVVRAAATLHEADIHNKNKQKQQERKVHASSSTKCKDGVPVAGVGEVDREQIAQQMAAALVAQGKTDVSSEELAQLVDAVIGMAEAKKREAKLKEQVRTIESHKGTFGMAEPSSDAGSGAASALQLLQSAYDDKKAEKESAVADAMDGLSDSDLETLLKNFNELSAEEQHSLIAYLKKLEAREPARVERLRQYVSADVPEQTPVREPPTLQRLPTVVQLDSNVKPVTIESDDDDYSVEEVFQSATQKVKEDRIRQEMEIVKKSLQSQTTPAVESPKVQTPVFDFAKNVSSAADLFALVQASIQSQSSNATPVTQIADVTPTTTLQPRSFGDLPEHPEQPKHFDIPVQNQIVSQNVNRDWDTNPPMTYNNENQRNQQSDLSTSIYNQPTQQNSFNVLVPLGNQMNFNQGSNRDIQFDRGQNYPMSYDGRNNYNDSYQGPTANQFNLGLASNQFNQGSNQFNQEQTGNQFNQGQTGNQFNQGQTGNQFNQGQTSNQFNKGSAGNQLSQGLNSNQFNQGPPGKQFNQGPRGNFVNGGNQNRNNTNQNFGNRPQFGNKYEQNNFRGRGRGFSGSRGRGRGYY